MPKPQEFTLTFEKGLNTVRSPLRAFRRSVIALDNVWLSPDDHGAVEAMPGYTRVNPAAISPSTFYAAATALETTGTRMNLIGYENGSQKRIIHLNPSGTTVGVFSEATSPAITKGDFQAAVLNDKVFIVNGADAPVMITNIDTASPTIAKMGVARPSVTNASVALNAGGNNSVKGVVSYYLAQMSATTEGALSVAVGPISCADGNRVDVDLSHADFSGKTYRVYRTLADGVQPFLLATVAGGAVYTDDVPDRDLTNLPFLHGDPPLAAYKSIVAYNDRLWALDEGGMLYWSDLDNPESWWNAANGNQFPVNEDDGDVGVTLLRDLTGLIVLKKHHAYRLVGTVPTNLRPSEITIAAQGERTFGTPTPHSVVSIPGGAAVYWNRGVYILSGSSAAYISAPIEDDLAGIRNQDEAGVFLGYFPQRRHLYVSVPLADGTTPDYTYIYDFNRQDWIGRRTVGFRGFLVTEDANGNEKFWALSAGTGGFVFEMESGVNADGAIIATKLKLPPFYGGNPAATKRFLYVDVHFKPDNSSGTFDMTLELDGKSADVDTYNVSQVRTSTDRERARVNYGLLGREVDVEVSSNVQVDNLPWKIYGLTYGWHEYGSRSV